MNNEYEHIVQMVDVRELDRWHFMGAYPTTQEANAFCEGYVLAKTPPHFVGAPAYIIFHRSVPKFEAQGE